MRIRDRDKDRAHPGSRNEAGFTLIELMIVVLIIGILIGLALPTFLGARKRAADRAMESDMRSGLAAALAYYTEASAWDGFDAATATAEEPRIKWVDASGPPGPTQGQTGIVIHSGHTLLLVGQSASGEYFCLAQIATNPATLEGRGPAFSSVDTVAECTGGW